MLARHAAVVSLSVALHATLIGVAVYALRFLPPQPLTVQLTDPAVVIAEPDGGPPGRAAGEPASPGAGHRSDRERRRAAASAERAEPARRPPAAPSRPSAAPPPGREPPPPPASEEPPATSAPPPAPVSPPPAPQPAPPVAAEAPRSSPPPARSPDAASPPVASAAPAGPAAPAPTRSGGGAPLPPGAGDPPGAAPGGAGRGAPAAGDPGAGRPRAGGSGVAALPPGPGGATPEYGPYLQAFRRRVQEALAYPPAARRQRAEGTVELEVVIDASGRVAQVHVVSSSAQPALDEAAVEAVRGLRPVPIPGHLPQRSVRVRLPLVFQLR